MESDASRQATPLNASFEITGQKGSLQDDDSSATPTKGQGSLTAHSKLSHVSNESEQGTVNHEQKEDSDDEDDFQDADETHEQGLELASYAGNIEIDKTTKKLDDISIETRSKPLPEKIQPTNTSKTNSYEGLASYLSPFSPRTPMHLPTRAALDHDADSEAFRNPIDVFVHSGANLSFGILLLLISLIPPVFGKLLYVIGFRGDRDRGLRMLWQASKFHNINGAMAGLVLLGYYNGLVGFCDILPDADPTLPVDSPDNIDGYPAQRLANLLEDMRRRYPSSKLWILEEARMRAAAKDLDSGIALLTTDSHSPLKQVHALSVFERSLQTMYAHRYEDCSASFQECCKLNNWSLALYNYIAASTHVELYRKTLPTSASTAAEHASKAVKLFQEARSHVGRKKFMARQLPFDTWVARKIEKCEVRAKERNIPLIDAIGVPPLTEMIYLWNGFKKMNQEQLSLSIAALDAHEDPAKNPYWANEAIDEKAISAILRAAISRVQGKYSDAMSLLKKDILVHDKAVFKGSLRDDWMAPTANYEMAALLWMQKTGELEEDKKLVREAQDCLDKAAKWESYDLDARMGMKVTTGVETVRAWRATFDP